MKVLHVVINGEIAGGQVVCHRIIEALIEKGHQALVVSPSQGPFVDLLIKKGTPVFFLPFEKTYSFHRALQLSALIRKENVDIVHTHGMVPMNIQARLAAKLAGVPCISHIHNTANFFNANPFIRRYQVFLDNWTSKFCSKLIAVSKSTKRSLVEQGVPEGLIRVIPNGVDPQRIRCQRSPEDIFRKFRINPGKRLVGMIGRLCPLKGQEEFLKAASLVTRQMPDVMWLIVGKDTEFGGEYERKLRALATRLELNGNVIFTGHQDDPFSLLNAMEFLVLPSKAEGMPLVILEAMALKKPVIASAVGGVPELIENGKDGVLVPAQDNHSLSQAMLQLLSQDGLSRRMGQSGFEKVRNEFLESKMITRLLAIYQEARR